MLIHTKKLTNAISQHRCVWGETMTTIQPFKATPSCIRLFVFTSVVAAAMSVLLAFELTQRQALLEQSQMRIDAPTAPAFMLDREFLQFQHALDTHLSGQDALSKDTLIARLDAFANTIDQVRDAGNSGFMFKNPQNITAVDAMHDVAQQARAALAHDDLQHPQ